MFSVGLDIHQKRIAICVLSETGQIVRRAQVRTIDEMMRVLEALPDRFEVCHEASCGYGHYSLRKALWACIVPPIPAGTMGSTWSKIWISPPCGPGPTSSA
jgi:hypothetical protein